MLRERFKLTHEAVTQGKEWKADDLISIAPDCSHLSRLTNELSQPTYKKSARGKVQVNKTPDGTKSPNLADSVMIAFAVAKAKSGPAVLLKRRR